MLETKKIIEFIETKEEWSEARLNKQRAINRIYGGLFGVGNFALYYGLEHYFLKEFMETIRASNPYFKYIFWISVAFAVWGGIRAIWGLVNYFQANSRADVLEMRVQQLKRELIETKV